MDALIFLCLSPQFAFDDYRISSALAEVWIVIAMKNIFNWNEENVVWAIWRMDFCFLRGPQKWLTAAKSANFSWLLNFTIRVFLKSAVISSHLSCPGSLWVAFLHAPHYEGSDRGQTITAKKTRLNRWIHTKKHSNTSTVNLLYLFYREKGKIMIFSVRRPQYFISHTKSQRLLVTRHRLSCEKVNLHNTLVTWAWGACGACCG